MLLVCIFCQNLEDSMMKNVLRSVMSETHFQGDDLRNLFVVFKVSEGRLSLWAEGHCDSAKAEGDDLVRSF